MGEEISSFDWLPAGWKVESRARKNGKRDKCYTDPSNKHKFYSKLEVLHYLKSIRIKHEERTKKSSKNCPATKIVLKEAVAEGLPAGWIKEIRVTKKGNKIRRDPYYIDPATGHLFRSMKEVSRYLDTGKKPKRAPRPKDQELIKSPAETGEERSANNKAQELGTEIPNQKAVDEAPPTEFAYQSKVDNLDQKEINEVSFESRSPVVADLQEKLQAEVEEHATECQKKRKWKKKRGDELPRRTSKRLAGISIELPLELKMRSQVHQAAAATHMGDRDAKCAYNSQDSKISSTLVKRVRTGKDADKKQEDLDVSSLGDASSEEEHAKQGVVKCKGDEQQETPLDSSLKDLWEDPCIEFAIKTLTGAIPIVEEQNIAKDPMFSVSVPGAVPENQDLPLENIWADPCIEFAVKTLTGDAPIGNSKDIHNVFQQPHYSTNLGGEKGLLLPDFWSNERSPGSVSFTHSDVANKTFHKQL